MHGCSLDGGCERPMKAREIDGCGPAGDNGGMPAPDDTSDRLARALAGGPRTLADLVAVIADGAPDGIGEEEVRAALIDDTRFTLLDEGYVHLPSLLAATTWTCPVTPLDQAHHALPLDPDLPVLAWWPIMEGAALRDAAGSEVGVLDVEPVVRDGAECDCLVGPPGWLDGLAGRWATLTVRHGGLVLGGLDAPPTPTDRQAAAVRAGFRRTLASDGDGGSPVEVADPAAIVLHALLEDPETVRASPMPPLSALLAAAGLEVHERMVAEPGADWAAHDDWARRQRARWLHRLPADDVDAFARVIELWEAYRHAGVEALGPDDASRRAAAGRIGALIAAIPVADAVLGDVIVRERGTDSLLAFLTELRHLDAPPSLGAAWLEACALDDAGDAPAAAELLDRALDDDCDDEAVVMMAAGYAADRGEAQRVLDLLRRLDGTEPADPEEEDPVEELLAEVLPFASRPKQVAGRNDPCPCGSGRKYKACHLGSETHSLTARAPWLYDKACRFLRWERTDELESVLEVVGQHLPDDLDDLARAPFVLDLGLHELGVFEDFLAARGPLLPVDEAMLAAQWSLVPRELFELVAVRPAGLRLRRLDGGEVVDIVETSLPQPLPVGTVLLARPLPTDGGLRTFGGLLPLPRELVDAALDALDDEDELAIAEVVAAVLGLPGFDVERPAP